MIIEVRILIAEEEPKSATGGILESLVRTILESHQYEITQNVNSTGLELDLLAKHKIKNEILYVECKAKEKPRSTEVKNFIFAMDYGVADTKADYGYFIYTQELDRQAAGLKLQLATDKKTVTFIGPDKILEILKASNKIKLFEISKKPEHEVTKLILVYSNHGYFYVPILQEGNVGQYYSVLNAKTLSLPSDIALKDIQSQIKEIGDLTYIQLSNESISLINDNNSGNIRDSILPIRESENWYDYTPASYQHFIGRMSIRRNLKGFLEKVRTRKTKNRIFFLDGKSGWGKSSLLSELKGSSLELKYWKGRISVLAVDTRSASTSNFVGLAFKKLIDDSLSTKFLENDLFGNIKITSPYEILSDNSIKHLLIELKKRKRLLVLIFDQFEDQFRKENLFEAFYRFCLDVDSLRENVVVGFSWKSEINIPLGNSAYLKFNQLKDFAYKITIPEFTQNDALQIIKQLEISIGEKLGTELERKLIESSQGYPWFIKKLCIHTLKQFKSGKTIDEITEQDMNCKELFEYDLLALNGEEQKALEYIAQRAFEGNPFEISEFDIINQDILNNLINLRLIIRTGSAYNIYWDIFRDYIVTKQMPVIGESYILRQSGKGCLNAFLSFKQQKILTLNEILNQFRYRVTEKTLLNILLELRSIGLVKKVRGQDIFELSAKVEEVTEEFFKKYITDKFKNYTPYLELSKLKNPKLEISDIIKVLKSIFKTEVFAEKTWSAYAKNLLIWFNLTDLQIKSKLVELRRGRGNAGSINKTNQIPFYSPYEIMKEFENYTKNIEVDDRKYRDFQLLELVTSGDDFLIDIEKENINHYLQKKAQELTILQRAFEVFKQNQRIKAEEFITSYPDIFSNYTTLSSKKQRTSIILSWAKFIYRTKEGDTVKYRSRGKKSDNYYLSTGPLKVLSILEKIDSGMNKLSKVTVRRLRDIEYIGLLSKSEPNYSLTEAGLRVLNSPDPEKELALIDNDHSDIKKFQLIYSSSGGKKLKKQEIVKEFSPFFPGLIDSSVYTKYSVYNSWNKFIKAHI